MKNWRKALALVLCTLMVGSTVACMGPGNNGGTSNGGNNTSVGGGNNTSVDGGNNSTDAGNSAEQGSSDKTQLNVFHYFAGFGDDWIIELAKNFEEKVKGIEFEPGKKGVDVLHKGEMRDFTSTQIKSGQYDVYFLESPKDFLNIMADGAVEPLDSIMTTPNAEDNNQTIEEKMTAQQKDFYNYNGHYYGIPHYAGNYGIIYNKDMFDERGFYIAETPDSDGNILISASNPTKSAGPDGKKGTEDDGLPRTYDEFFDLCIEINAVGVDPICFPGQYTQQHLMLLLDNLVATHEGVEGMLPNYTFSGTTELVVIQNGKIKRDTKGNPVTESVEITEENAYLLAREEGRYYAMDFLTRLLSDTDYYNEADGENTAVSHVQNQQKFLENESRGKRPSAMLIDGTWWQMEADDVFTTMAKRDEKYSKDNRKFGWMPLPQATEEEAAKIANGTKKSVFSDYLNAVACIKSGLPDGVREAALAFLQYAYTDEALANFTYTTATTIGVEYLDVIDRNRLNYYEKSLIDYIQNSELIYQVPTSALYAKNLATLAPSLKYGSGDYGSLEAAVWEEEMTAEEYFLGHQDFFKGCAW